LMSNHRTAAVLLETLASAGPADLELLRRLGRPADRQRWHSRRGQRQRAAVEVQANLDGRQRLAMGRRVI
jgi:hypothetical protein